jgi:MFS family permease
MSFTSAGRDLRWVVGAKAVSWLGDEVALVAMTLRLQSGGHGAAAVAALLIANLLPIALLSPLVGRVVDRYDNRALLVGSSAVQALACVALAFVLTPATVLALMLVLGAGQAVNSATWTALLPAIVGADRLPKAIGLSQAATTVAGIVAPAVGGLLTGRFGARVPLLVDAASFVVVLVAALAIHARRTVARSETGLAPRGGLAIVRRDALLRPLFVLLALFVLIGSMVNVVEVFLIRGTLHASTTWYGVAGAMLSAGALVGAVLSGRLAGPARLARGFVLSCVALAITLVGIGLSPSVLCLLPITFALGAANGVLNVTLSSLVMGRARDAERGRVGALLGGVASGMQLVAFAAGGALASQLSPRTVFVLAGAFGLLAPMLFGRGVLRAASRGEAADSTVMKPAPALT